MGHDSPIMVGRWKKSSASWKDRPRKRRRARNDDRQANRSVAGLFLSEVRSAIWRQANGRSLEVWDNFYRRLARGLSKLRHYRVLRTRNANGKNQRIKVMVNHLW